MLGHSGPRLLPSISFQMHHSQSSYNSILAIVVDEVSLTESRISQLSAVDCVLETSVGFSEVVAYIQKLWDYNMLWYI
jgi:hypothetical protein